MIHEILNSYSLTIDYLRRLIDDVPEEALTGQRAGVVNHPLWTMGHLVYAAQMIGGEIGVPTWLPADWQNQYGTGSVPSADRSAYPSKTYLLDCLNDAQRRLSERLRQIGDRGLQQPLPDVRYRDIFPSLGHAVTHVLCTHTAGHVGQIIVWRRAMGWPPLSEAFH